MYCGIAAATSSTLSPTSAPASTASWNPAAAASKLPLFTRLDRASSMFSMDSAPCLWTGLPNNPKRLFMLSTACKAQGILKSSKACARFSTSRALPKVSTLKDEANSSRPSRPSLAPEARSFSSFSKSEADPAASLMWSATAFAIESAAIAAAAGPAALPTFRIIDGRVLEDFCSLRKASQVSTARGASSSIPPAANAAGPATPANAVAAPKTGSGRSANHPARSPIPSAMSPTTGAILEPAVIAASTMLFHATWICAAAVSYRTAASSERAPLRSNSSLPIAIASPAISLADARRRNTSA